MTTDTCTHHWVLEGTLAAAEGVCKRCGAVRAFDPGTDIKGAFDWRAASVRDTHYASTTGLRKLAEEL